MDLSVIIPARNEEFLQRTIEDVLKNARGETEVIAILDGYWPDKGIPMRDHLIVVHHEHSIGQRAATNEGVKLSRAKYIMKLDAHCALDEGFDVKLMEDCEYDWTVLPRMYVLDAFHWVCSKCGKHHQQGPERGECNSCGPSVFTRELVWGRKKRKKTDYMWINEELRIKYFDKPSFRPYGDPDGSNINELKKKYSHKKKDWAKGKITDVMVGIGACWFQHRDYYLELGGLDEDHGSWGQVAVELAMKTWLSGGRQVVNKKTWFAHLPRTQKGFSFPYPHSSGAQEKAREYSRKLWLGNNWKGQKHEMLWLIEKFGPLPGWEKKEPIMVNLCSKIDHRESNKGLVYYTDNQCEERVINAVRKRLISICDGMPIVSVSQYPIEFGENLVIPEERSNLTMFKQILAGLESLDTEIAFLIEHDILYHPSHFEFTPPEKDVFYYNQNRWAVDAKTGQALHYLTKATSHCCAYRKLLVEHYEERVERVEKEGYKRSQGYSPGSRKPPAGFTHYATGVYFSEYPNVDIRHSNNFTRNRFRIEQFRKKPKGWVLADEIPSWGKTKDRFDDFLREYS